jgi:endo-1,4-beta-xylanase
MNSPAQTDVSGNEWMNVRKVDRTLLADLRPREDVIAEANEGIDKHRKSDVTLRIVDRANGESLRGATVTIEQTGHAFEFGCSAGFTLPQTRDDPVKQARAALFADLFNCTTAKCYWDECWHQPIEQQQGVRVTRTFLDEVDWAAANGIAVRGHPLVWMVPKAVPQWVLKYPYEKQLQFVEHNLRSLIACTRGRVKLWDLVNEMLWEPSLRHLPQREWPHIETVDEMLTYIEPAIHWAREEDPTSTYVLNDYGLEINVVNLGGRTVTATDQRRRFRELVAEMQKRNCAPDAIGTQAHDCTWSPADLFKKVLDDLASTGVPVQVAEFWAHDNACPNHESMSPEQVRDAKIQYVTDCYTIAFGHPRVTHFTCWGNEMFYEDGDPTVRHYKAAWMPSKLYKAVHALVKQKWWTPRTTLTTDAAGEIALRATHGRHRATVLRPGGRQWSTEIDVRHAKTAATIDVV